MSMCSPFVPPPPAAKHFLSILKWNSGTFHLLIALASFFFMLCNSPLPFSLTVLPITARVS